MSYSYDATALGQYGAVVETGTTAVTGNFAAITVLDDATFSAITGENLAGDVLTGFAIAKGITLFGRFTGFTLTSGKVIAYNNGIK
jgi:hypothetical protein